MKKFPGYWIGWWLAALLGCSGNGGEDETLRDCRPFIFYKPQGPTQQVAVVGDFQGLLPATLPMDLDRENGWYWARLDLPPGEYLYRISVDGESLLDRSNPLTLFDAAEQEQSLLRVEDCSRPSWKLLQLDSSADGRMELALRFLRARSRSPLDRLSLESILEDGSSLELERVSAEGEVRLRTEGLSAGKHRVRVSARDADGAEAESLVLPFWAEDQPFDWRDAVLYQIVVDRFRRKEGQLEEDVPINFYRGGDLDGVVAAVEEGTFQRLGVNTLWLSPLYENPDKREVGRDGHLAEPYHGYWPSEPRTVEKRFGGEEALDRLITAAHARGMRVLMDLVLNHVHETHPYYREHTGGEWFANASGECICGVGSCSWDRAIESCWFDPFLPDLRFQNREVLEQMLGDALWWLTRFDLDGFRLDAIPMMPRLVTRHLRDRVHRQLESQANQVYLVGETYTAEGGQGAIRASLGPQGLSGQFDFPVMWALRAALSGRAPMAQLDEELALSEAAWEGSGAVMAMIIGNHDVPRILTELNGDPWQDPWGHPPGEPARDLPFQLLEVAFSFLFTQQGVPVIYYGDEIGMPGGADPDNRRNFQFGPLSGRQAALRAHVERLGLARACSAALRRGARRTLLVDNDLYAYGRAAEDGFPVVVVLNRRGEMQEVALELPAEWGLAPSAVFRDWFGSPVEQDGARLRMTVPARGSLLLVSDPNCASTRR